VPFSSGLQFALVGLWRDSKEFEAFLIFHVSSFAFSVVIIVAHALR